MEAEPKELGAEHHATQTLTFTDSIGEVKDEAAPGWSAAAADMKFEYLLYGHREQLACQVCGKTFLDESRLRYGGTWSTRRGPVSAVQRGADSPDPTCSFHRKHEKLHSAERPFACEICSKAFTTHAHLKGNTSTPASLPPLTGCLTPPPPAVCSRTPEDPHGLQALQV